MTLANCKVLLAHYDVQRKNKTLTGVAQKKMEAAYQEMSACIAFKSPKQAEPVKLKSK